MRLYAEKESPKYEKAALRWREHYLSEGTPRLGSGNVAKCGENFRTERGGGSRLPLS